MGISLLAQAILDKINNFISELNDAALERRRDKLRPIFFIAAGITY
jgi:hypothetical protein